MIRLAVIAPLFLAALFAGGALASTDRRETEPPPFVFESLSWDMSQREFETKIGARAIKSYNRQSVSADGTTLSVSTAWGLDWEHFGRAQVSVARDEGGRIHWLGVETVDDRLPDPEAANPCDRPHTLDTPGCRTAYHWELIGVLEALMRDMGRLYGESDSHSPDTPDFADAPDISYIWNRRGFDLRLRMQRPEIGPGSISLTATRRHGDE